MYYYNTLRNIGASTFSLFSNSGQFLSFYATLYFSVSAQRHLRQKLVMVYPSSLLARYFHGKWQVLCTNIKQHNLNSPGGSNDSQRRSKTFENFQKPTDDCRCRRKSANESYSNRRRPISDSISTPSRVSLQFDRVI